MTEPLFPGDSRRRVDGKQRPEGEPPERTLEAEVPVRIERASAHSTRGAHEALAASKFIGRLAQLDLAAVSAAVRSWHEIMRAESDAWFAAERATAHAVSSAGRRAEQEILLGHVAECFRRAVWYRRTQPQAPPEVRVGSTEASAQYLATVAMVALLVRDCLDPYGFELLYRPFARHIPVEELARE